VREGRLELPLCRQSWILSPVRLPIPPLSHTHLTLYPISLDTSIRNNTDNVNANSCQEKRMKALNTCPKKFQPGPVRILVFLILCFLSSGAIPAVAKQPLFDAYKRIIVLDPGHGGRESGARGADGTAEKAVALKLAELIAAELERDYKVTLTRSDDYHVDLDHRTALANHLKADIFISLHTGGSFVYSSAGPIVYYYQKASKRSSSRGANSALPGDGENMPIPWGRVQNNYTGKSRVLARMISSRLNTLDSVKNIRIQGAPLAVLQGAQMPAILIEAGYLTNPAEEKNLRNNRFLTDVAAEISRGIEDFLTRSNQNE
jgi:N-acetylmuramoyl-L-alanine amidase